MKILIVTAATGQGHLTAAAALAEGFTAAGADPVVLDACAHPAVKAAAASYNFFLRRSPRWMSGYYAGVHLARLPILGGRVVASWCDDIFEKERPDLIVSVHPIVNFAIAETRERKGSTVPFAIVLTDPHPPFWRGWAERRADRTVVPTAEAARRLVELKINPHRITVGGMPVPRSFRKRTPEAVCATVRGGSGCGMGASRSC